MVLWGDFPTLRKKCTLESSRNAAERRQPYGSVGGHAVHRFARAFQYDSKDDWQYRVNPSAMFRWSCPEGAVKRSLTRSTLNGPFFPARKRWSIGDLAPLASSTFSPTPWLSRSTWGFVFIPSTSAGGSGIKKCRCHGLGFLRPDAIGAEVDSSAGCCPGA
jgi:hypothetical protein